MARLRIPGSALGIVHGDRIVGARGFGVADPSGRAVTAQTPFYIGSLTKSFTALAVMHPVEAGRIDLDAPVRNSLPWFQVADRQASGRITVRQLLNHTTGLSEKDGNHVWSSSAGLIVEEVSGQPYADYVSQRILQPLGMEHATASPARALAGGLAEGHSYRFGHPFPGVGPLPPPSQIQRG